eukprot:PhM_4_TR834/c0_g1_i1/m.59590
MRLLKVEVREVRREFELPREFLALLARHLRVERPDVLTGNVHDLLELRGLARAVGHDEHSLLKRRLEHLLGIGKATFRGGSEASLVALLEGAERDDDAGELAVLHVVLRGLAVEVECHRRAEREKARRRRRAHPKVHERAVQGLEVDDAALLAEDRHAALELPCGNVVHGQGRCLAPELGDGDALAGHDVALAFCVLLLDRDTAEVEVQVEVPLAAANLARRFCLLRITKEVIIGRLLSVVEVEVEVAAPSVTTFKRGGTCVGGVVTKSTALAQHSGDVGLLHREQGPVGRGRVLGHLREGTAEFRTTHRFHTALDVLRLTKRIGETGLKALNGIVQSVVLGHSKRESVLPGGLEPLNLLRNVAENKGVLERQVGVVGLHKRLRDALDVALEQVREAHAGSVVGAHVGRHGEVDLAVLPRNVRESGPALGLVENRSVLLRDLQVAALNGKVEEQEGVADEVHGDLGVVALLEIGNESLAVDLAALEDLENLCVALLDQGELNAHLRDVEHLLDNLAIAANVPHGVATSADKVDGLI